MEWENDTIIGKLTDDNIADAKDVLERAKTGWPDMADIETALMVKKEH